MSQVKMVIGGVAQNNHVSWLHDDVDNGICLDWEIHLCDCPGDDYGYHDDCWEYMGQEDYLIGFIPCEFDDKEAWFKHQGEHGSLAYKLDRDAEYSAIVGEIYTQVVASKYISLCALCSPCYPGQGDLDTAGEYPTRALPPGLYDLEYDSPLPIVGPLPD